MNRNAGYTLIELMVATASASVLMVGLSSALFVSSRALDMDGGAIASRNTADEAIARMMADLREARSFSQLAAGEAEFLVPDRDNDGTDETIHYRWTGVAGGPLQRSVNGGAYFDLVKNVNALSFTALARTLPAVDVTIAPPPPWPILESFSSEIVDTKTNQLVLAAPTGVQEGELLLACVAVHNKPASSMIPPAGWIQLDLNDDANHVTFGVWWKLATASEPADYSWRWTGDDGAVGVGLRISNQYAGNPITATAAANGDSISPTCSATSTVLDHSMVLRFGGLHQDDPAAIGETGLADHIDVYMDGMKDMTAGVGYRIQTVAGTTGSADFELTKSQDYRTLTVVVAPKQ